MYGCVWMEKLVVRKALYEGPNEWNDNGDERKNLLVGFDELSHRKEKARLLLACHCRERGEPSRLRRASFQLASREVGLGRLDY